MSASSNKKRRDSSPFANEGESGELLIGVNSKFLFRARFYRAAQIRLCAKYNAQTRLQGSVFEATNTKLQPCRDIGVISSYSSEL